MGSDCVATMTPKAKRGFNSRSRMGSDVSPTKRAKKASVSIRAPAWGATAPAWVFPVFAVFQFALPHGERQIAPHVAAVEAQFQFALPHGERLPSCNGRYSLHRKRTIR
ncbi:hypothetical protein HMPREF0198_0837 [Cardiobacterium hominis ATCC 15826]|uniref:Uncharacterized protein n=1 Tax=Cardiobacterium hominis (strain ATCC 15826 / DSM 8339 / NCTC 10426 / 6573) TaxID=638300 RepID=C8N8L0_CARH6|nr:hypothetical protein HMPREF0198_0837 [Cardiobacterium hominis ATCC 15826]